MQLRADGDGARAAGGGPGVPGAGPPRLRRTFRGRSTTGWRSCAAGRPRATRPATSAARGPRSSAAAAARRSSRSSSTRSSPPRARRSSSTSSASTSSARRCCASAPTSSGAATSRRSSRRRRSGARASRSPRPARTSPRCARARSSTTTTSSSAARRPGSRGGSTRAGAGCSRARTSPVARHRGISMLIVDMRSPGVEVRPMTQITGHAEFCELFLDDVVVPKAEPARPSAATAGRSPCTRSATSAAPPRCRAR